MNTGSTSMFALGIVLICVIFGAFGQISMKKGMNQLERIESIEKLLNPGTLIKILENPYVLCGLLLYTIAALLWLGALSTLDVSYMYPLLSLAYVITAVFALFYLEETLPIGRWIGIALVIIGCILITKT